MGALKQLLPLKGKSLIWHAANTAIETGWWPVIVVAGTMKKEISAGIAGLKLQLVENPDWEKGMSGSIKTGLAAMLKLAPELPAVVIMVCDQPYVTPALLQELFTTRRVSGAPIVASAYAGTLGTPAIFSREVFPELMALEGDSGARKLLKTYGHKVATVEFPEGEIDIDTPTDYTNFRLLNNE